jgi:choline dehydrogenase
MDQPAAVILAIPANGSAETSNGGAPFLQLAGRMRAFPGFDADDAYYLCLFAGMPVDPALAPLVRAERAHWLIVGDLAPESTGTIRLESADPAQPPVCDLNFYAAERDLARMRAGFRELWELAQHDAFRSTVERFALIGPRMVADDGRVDGLIRGRTMSRQPWGGCPMGPAMAPDAVVDAQCRVYGVEGLRVVDASVVPVPLRAGGALTTMMIAERIAERIREAA